MSVQNIEEVVTSAMSAGDGCGYSRALAASLLSEETPNMKSFSLTYLLQGEEDEV